MKGLGLAGVLAEHEADGADCACSEYVLDEPYRAHLEAVVLDWVRERLAGARDDVAAEVDRTGWKVTPHGIADAALAAVAEVLGAGEVRG